MCVEMPMPRHRSAEPPGSGSAKLPQRLPPTRVDFAPGGRESASVGGEQANPRLAAAPGVSDVSGRHDVEVDRRLDLVGHLHRDLVRTERLDRVAHDDLPLVDLGTGATDRGGDVTDRHGAEQPATVTGSHRQLEGGVLKPRLDGLGVVEVTDLATGPGGFDRLDGPLAASGPADREATWNEEVPAVAVTNLDDVAGGSEPADFLGQDELHSSVSSARRGRVRQQSHLASVLDRDGDVALVLDTVARDPARPDLAAVGDELAQQGGVLVVDVGHLVLAELADLLLGLAEYWLGHCGAPPEAVGLRLWLGEPGSRRNGRMDVFAEASPAVRQTLPGQARAGRVRAEGWVLPRPATRGRPRGG